jgi:hypothetical protein
LRVLACTNVRLKAKAASSLLASAIDVAVSSFSFGGCRPIALFFPLPSLCFLSRQRKNKGVGAEKRGILLFRFLTSNETLKYQSKKLKIRPDIKLTQVDFFQKSRFPSPSRSAAKKGQSGLICIRSSRHSKDF